MNKQITKIELREKLTKTGKVHTNYMEIRKRKASIALVATNLTELGRLFKTFRDGKYYIPYHCKTFKAFLKLPEINFNYKTVASLIRIYELFILKLKIDPKLLVLIGHAKLQVINTVVEEDPRKWIAEAKKNNRDDLIKKVRIAQRKVALFLSRHHLPGGS